MMTIIGTIKCLTIPITDRMPREGQGRQIEGGLQSRAQISRCARPPLLSLLLGSSRGMRRKLEYSRFLSLKHLSEQQGKRRPT